MKKEKNEKRFVQAVKGLWRDRQLSLMALPSIVLLIMFNYIPMFGLVLAFKKFNFSKGLFGSPWNGLDNFKFIFLSGDMFTRMTRNTVLYYLMFTIVGTLANVFLAIALNELVFKRAAKIMQSVMIIPTFISYVAVTFIVTSVLDYQNGMLNHLIASMDENRINFYMHAKYWPLILLLVKVWKDTGYGSVIYLSVLAGIDPELYDSASIDGANGFQKMRHITIPMLIPTVVIMTLLSLGNIMSSNTGLFYRVTKNSGALYSTTQVLDSYVYNAIRNGGSDFGVTSAVTFYQSIVGFIMTVGVNLIVRKKSPEHALF